MLMRLLAAVSLVIAPPAWAAGTGVRIGNEDFAAADILDARAMPQLGNGAALMITFSENAARRLSALTAKATGKPIPVAVEGRVVSTTVLPEPIVNGVFQISEQNWTIATATTLARQISGRDPLPESLDDQP